MLATFIQQVINGLMLGGGYALVAIGYTLIFGVLNLLHLAHGEVAMIGSYVGLTLVFIAMSQVGVLPVWVVLIAAMIGAGIVGIVVELVAFRPLGRKQLHITPLITTIAVAFVLQEAAVKLFGSEQRSFPVAMFDQLKQHDLQLGTFRITSVQMFIIGAFFDAAISQLRSLTGLARKCSLTTVRSGLNADLRTSTVACGSAAMRSRRRSCAGS